MTPNQTAAALAGAAAGGLAGVFCLAAIATSNPSYLLAAATCVLLAAVIAVGLVVSVVVEMKRGKE